MKNRYVTRRFFFSWGWQNVLSRITDFFKQLIIIGWKSSWFLISSGLKEAPAAGDGYILSSSRCRTNAPGFKILSCCLSLECLFLQPSRIKWTTMFYSVYLLLKAFTLDNRDMVSNWRILAWLWEIWQSLFCIEFIWTLYACWKCKCN